MKNKTKLIEDVFLYLSQKEKIPIEITETDEYKKEISKIIQEFPLILKGDSGFKNPMLNEITTEKMLKGLNTSVNDKTLYTDKMMNAYSKTKYPFQKVLLKQNNYIYSSILNDDEIYDFVGNAAFSPYYKTIKRLLVNNGSYLTEEYKNLNLPDFVKERIEIIEEWFKTIIFETEAYIDNYTTQTLFPLNNSYVSISPAQSLGLVAKIISKSREFSNENYKIKQELQKKFKKEFKALATLKKKPKVSKKEIKEQKDKVDSLKKEINSIPFIKIATWQKMVGKIQNFGLLAPAAKKGIFLADAPNYDLVTSQSLWAKNYDIDNFIRSTLKDFYYKNKTFQTKADKFINMLIEYSDKDKSINKEIKDKQYNFFLVLFKEYYQRKDIKKDLDNNSENIEEIVDSFISNFLLLNKEKPVILYFATEAKFYHYIVNAMKGENNEI